MFEKWFPLLSPDVDARLRQSRGQDWVTWLRTTLDPAAPCRRRHPDPLCAALQCLRCLHAHPDQDDMPRRLAPTFRRIHALGDRDMQTLLDVALDPATGLRPHLLRAYPMY